MTRPSWTARVIVVLGLALVPVLSFAQALAPADAAEFMGSWTMSMDSPQGPFEQELSLKDVGGKVVGTITNQMMPEQQVTDVSKSGKDLVLKYAGNFQGNAFDAKLTITPDGFEKAKVVFDVNSGMFTMSGTATKK